MILTTIYSHTPEETSKTTKRNASTKLTDIVDSAMEGVFGKDSVTTSVDEYFLKMEGMSGRFYRVFINKVIRNIEDARYLEIGSWGGSTACSALYGNKCSVTCIDNWELFGGPKDLFHNNIGKALKDSNVDFKFIESDFRKVDYSSIGKHNVYLFDGPHDKKSQKDGVYIVEQALDDEFVFIVDDWNWSNVREGTFEGIETLGAEVLYSSEIRTTHDNSHVNGDMNRQKGDWHNGIFVAVLKK